MDYKPPVIDSEARGCSDADLPEAASVEAYKLPSIKIALIDDGINPKQAKVFIEKGMAFYEHVPEDEMDQYCQLQNGLHRPESFGVENFYTFDRSKHGTKMAFCMKKIFPRIKLCFARLDDRPARTKSARGDKFTIKSAIKVSHPVIIVIPYSDVLVQVVAEVSLTLVFLLFFRL